MSDSNRQSGYSFDLTMLVGAVFTVVALCVFLFFLGVKYGADSERPKQQAASGASKTNENAKLGCLESLAPLDKINCLEKQITAERESKRADYDLAAQQQMADWALLIVIISGVQAILSLGGIYLLVRNLNLAREATNAAIQGNVNTNRAIDLDNRPWLDFKVTVASNFGHNDTDFWPRGVGIDINIEIKNYGKSPALGIRTKVAEVLPFDIDMVTDYYLEEPREKLRLEYASSARTGVALFPNDLITLTDRIVVSDEAIRLAPRVAKIEDTPEEISLVAWYVVSVHYISPTSQEVLEASSVYTLWSKYGRDQMTSLTMLIGANFKTISKHKIVVQETGYKRTK